MRPICSSEAKLRRRPRQAESGSALVLALIAALLLFIVSFEVAHTTRIESFIAHNVEVGAHTVIAGCTAIAGSTQVGASCMIAGGVGITGHLEIADRVVITAMTLVSSSIREPGTYSGSIPMDEAVSWRRNSASCSAG